MTDAEMIKLLQAIKDRCSKQATDLEKLKSLGVEVNGDDGTTLDDRIQREHKAAQSLENTIQRIRNRIAAGTGQ